ncbi:MAG: sigma-70 family RNA polymerase sigma factor [Verrucomicrobia bacterium]|nr:MAG: sigma-70 family RNA polymerase sigma factor [Verrucomicrobiota bacterium]
MSTPPTPAPPAEAPEEVSADHEKPLIEAARRGDLDAFDALVRRYQERIYTTLYHFTGNHEDAADLTQETFIKAFRALKSFRGDASFFTWVYRIGVNKALNFLKQSRRRRTFSLNDLDERGARDVLRRLVSETTPLRHIGLRELQQRLNAAMQKLSEVHRMVVILHDIQGLPHEEISRILRCNVGTVRSRLFYARQQLQGLLSDLIS